MAKKEILLPLLMRVVTFHFYLGHFEVVACPEGSPAQLFKGTICYAATSLGKRDVTPFDSETKNS